MVPFSISDAGLLGAEHVPQGVVERAEIRIDFGGEVAGQEPESLPCFDRGSGEDDPTNRAVDQAVHGCSHGQIGLAGPGRPDAKGEGVLPDGLHVLLLAMGLGADHPASAYRNPVTEDPRRAGNVLAHHLDDFVDPAASSWWPSWTRIRSSLEHGSGLSIRPRVAPEGHFVTTRDKAHLREVGLDLTEMAIGLSQEIQQQMVAGYA